MKLKILNKTGLELSIVLGDSDFESLPTEEYIKISLTGGDSSNPSWKDYLEGFEEVYQPHIQLIKQAIIELGWVGRGANEMANDTYFIFSDKTIFTFSWRAWGDLMQAIVDKNEGYMTYYYV